MTILLITALIEFALYARLRRDTQHRRGSATRTRKQKG